MEKAIAVNEKLFSVNLPGKIKERQWSPAVRPFVPNVQRGERLDSHKQLAASSPPLSIPNSYLCEESSRRNLTGKSTSGNSPKQRLPSTDGTQGDAQSKRGYSSSRRTRGTSDASERPVCVHQTTALKSNAEICSQDKNMNSRLLNSPRRGLRVSRSVPNSSDRHKSVQADCVTFEVKMSDFPELGVVAPCSQALAAPQKSETPIPIHHVQSTKTTLVIKAQRKDPSQCIHSSENTEASLQGQPVAAFSQSSCLPVTSWANVASQPPKKVVPKETVNNRPSSEEKLLQQVSEKKKKRKKKKSKTAGGEVEELEEVVSYQEPPKFEDEDEFPDLSLALSGTARLQSQSSVDFTNRSLRELVKKEGHSEGPGIQSGDQNKHITRAEKALSADTKKGQKVKQTSGRKSKVPVQLDIGNMLDVLEKKRQTQKDKPDAKPAILSVGGSLPVGHMNPQVVKKPWLQDKIAHNPLDSTSPLVKKGKQREVPKAKKPTPLKRVILKEREDRKQNRLLEERGLPTSSEESKMAGDVAEELGETTIDEDQQDSKVLEEQQTEIHDDTSKEEEQADEDVVEKDRVAVETDGLAVETDGLAVETDGLAVETDGLAVETDGLAVETKETTNQLQRRTVIQPKIHSRKFRDYCSQVLSKDVDECVSILLKELVRFQDRLYQKDPLKARMKRRLVMGLREVLKHLKLRKVKCVVISPNCERIQSKGGLDEAVHNIIDTCREQGVPFVFALSRKALGRCVNKAVPVSLVGIFNYDGAQDHYHKMIELSSEARRAYEVMVENSELKAQGPQETPQDLQPSPPESSEIEEPEYIKLWKKMLEKECNHKFLNFEQKFSSVPWTSDCRDKLDEES
ncbi:hypothetical protein UPYG_G00187390 [Umbra pygmaea]|uniref:Ribosomal protein eL8/eL30/eS12/Gadd45 domain-containing protein n=1 Tax=Umbra pygmaea TaxID=75934 RepID=A0ABD0WSR0_UMBPY